MAFDFTSFVGKTDLIQLISNSFTRQQIYWQPLKPNLATSSPITMNLYFGRAIYLPMPRRRGGVPSRVIVMSGCTNKNNTKTNCSEVQEWSLDDMTVRKLQPLVPARTSYSCIHKIKDRFIYVLGGNHQAHQTLNDVQRLDIYKKRWEELPSMNE